MNQRCVFCNKTIEIGVFYELCCAILKAERWGRTKRTAVVEYKNIVICEECLRDGLAVEVSSIEGFTKIELGI